MANCGDYYHPNCMLAAKLAQHYKYLASWVLSTLLTLSPSLNFSRSSPNFSFLYKPAFHPCDLFVSCPLFLLFFLTSPVNSWPSLFCGHVHSSIFSICSGLFQMSLAIISRMSTLKAFHSTIKKILNVPFKHYEAISLNHGSLNALQ